MKFQTVLFAILYLTCLVLALLAPAKVNAQTTDEIRQYDVIVKNKPVGNVSIRISQDADGTTTATTDTSIEAAFLFIKYRYEFHSNEQWRGDRFVQMASRTNDNGTPLSVQAVVAMHDSQIDVQGKVSRTGPPLAMTENYWRLPGAEAAKENFSIIEPDTGIVRSVRLQSVGPDSVTVDGHAIACNHYRLTGEAAADLWYDAQGRLVRQQTVEQGYPTEQRLARIRSEPKAPSGDRASLTGYHN